MHLLITDRLICPRCGPEFGLILMAHRLEDRRIHEGFFGCANCREEYPIQGGFGDLRFTPRPEVPVAPMPGVEDPEGALRLAALLGVREGPGLLLLAGAPALLANQVAGMIEGVEVVALHPGLRGATETEGVSRMVALTVLPFRSRSLRGAALDGEDGMRWVAECGRVLGVGGRLVLFAPPDKAGDAMKGEGFELILEEDAVLIGRIRGG